jgi:uncharacterized protein involved in exopolysaccharide biosynthesis
LELAIATLKRERDIVIDGFKRQTEIRLAALEREFSQAKILYEQFAKHQSEGQIAKALSDRQDVRLAAPAVAPSKPQPGRRSLIVLGIACLGIFFGFCHAIVRNTILPKEKIRH